MPFSSESIEFLFRNHIEDSRQWFRDHKKEYRELLIEPLRDLVIDLTPAMLEIDDHFITDPRVDKTICRIWRDLRYTRDPSLYRDTMWIVFKRDRMNSTEYPGFYFEITCSGFNYGCGFYQAPTGYMHTLRSLILHNDLLFRKADRAFRNQNIYHMDGECFKRPRYGDQPANMQNWLERKNIGFNAESEDLDLLFSPLLSEKLAAELKLLAPIYDLMLEAALRYRHEHPNE